SRGRQSHSTLPDGATSAITSQSERNAYSAMGGNGDEPIGPRMMVCSAVRGSEAMSVSLVLPVSAVRLSFAFDPSARSARADRFPTGYPRVLTMPNDGPNADNDMLGRREPGESDKARINRELIELLNELRVALPGVQVLFAFLLV